MILFSYVLAPLPYLIPAGHASAEYRAEIHREFEWMRDGQYADDLILLSNWLSLESVNQPGSELVYQYDIAFEHLVTGLQQRLANRDFQGYRRHWNGILGPIHRFEHEHAEDVQTIVATKLARALDKPHWPELLQLFWNDIKAGKTDLDFK